MAETKVLHVQCDFCPVREPTDSEAADKFKRIGVFDVCPRCFKQPFGALSHGVGEAWRRLKRSGDGPHNCKVMDLLTKMFHAALHDHVGGEETE